ncbi:hypothetical protein Q3V23_00365 [Streptomyces sp. VNUA116]|uniref:hypothetical protein n=1 Tax=Streptomyces sp. VNUA116 TaxID=3062449 RepID=UPI00267540DF|nr:hypothetical protein [Streptomyces sp. VNUA116]WKU42651.1 hypothetical protein Q3V23_00365 [Streptomyces sp. VNUA116]
MVRQLKAYRAALDIPEQGEHCGREAVATSRSLVEQLRLGHWQMGTLYLKIAPAWLLDRATAHALAAAFREDPSSYETAERIERRRYAMTGDHQALEEWESQPAPA